MYRIEVVCTGNVCRSPMSELVLRRAFEQEGLADRVNITSAGLAAWDPDEPMDPRSSAVLLRNGFTEDQVSGFVARPFRQGDIPQLDLLLALDRGHEDRLLAWAPPGRRDRIHLLRSFDPQAAGLPREDLDIPDPWLGEDADFDEAYRLIEASAAGVVQAVRAELDP